MKLKPFKAEQWMTDHENDCKYNLTESCVQPFKMDELLELLGIKEKYIQRYGYAYELESPDSDKLMLLFMKRCRENKVLCTPDACFSYMNEFPDKHEQISIFDMI